MFTNDSFVRKLDMDSLLIWNLTTSYLPTTPPSFNYENKMGRLCKQWVLTRVNIEDIEILLAKSRLQWLGHIGRMEDFRAAKIILFGELEHDSRSVRRPKLRYKDNCKQLLKRIDLLIEILLQRIVCYGDQKFELSVKVWMFCEWKDIIEGKKEKKDELFLINNLMFSLMIHFHIFLLDNACLRVKAIIIIIILWTFINKSSVKFTFWTI